MTSAKNRLLNGDWLNDQQIHPLRDYLTQELHARPFESLQTPLDIFLFAKFTGEGDSEDTHDKLVAFCNTHEVTPPAVGSRHHRLAVEGHQLRWERHGEFTTYTLFYQTDSAAEPFSGEVPQFMFDWLAMAPGELLVATHMSCRDMDEELHTDEYIKRYLRSESLVSTNVASNEAQVWTDLIIHPCGFNRILLLNRALKTQKLGRVTQRLLDISTYRNMALLALPVAQATAGQIVKLDKDLSSLLDQLRDSSQYEALDDGDDNPLESDSQMLESLTDLSMSIQRQSAQSRNRLSAADAYYALINSRIQELNESRVVGYQTIGEFIQRRLSPAMRTCTSVQSRLEDLSKRTARTVDLLRTRLDLTLERQNHRLFESMNKRARIQMRLQETVEGLSIAAITYYFVGLIGYMAKSTKGMGLGVSPEMITGLSVIPIGMAVWYSIRQIKRKIHGIASKKQSS
jgi:uncharacterized membrane-anchored protein